MVALLQKGQPRADGTMPLVVMYWMGSKSLLRALDPRCHVLLSGAAGKHGQLSPSSGSNPPLAALEALAKNGVKRSADDTREVRCYPVILAGFSEGCAALRAQIAAGYTPQAVVAVDGIHSSKPPKNEQLEPWFSWVQRCGWTGPAQWFAPETQHQLWASCSQIVPPTFSSVRATLELVLATFLPPRPDPYVGGGVSVWSFPGADAAAHKWQASTVLPHVLWMAARTWGCAGTRPGSAAPYPAGKGGAKPPIIDPPDSAASPWPALFSALACGAGAGALALMG
jgi:hypothetical protein